MARFDTIDPSRHIVLTLPNDLRVAIIDAPSAAADTATAAALWVPRGRENDWIFTTFSGQLHLLHSSQECLPISRLILLSNSSNYRYDSNQIDQLLQSLAPKLSSAQVHFVVYEDGVVRCSILEVLEGDNVGEMLVEDVELETDSGAREFRRRLRFKRMPNFVQSQVKIRPKDRFHEEASVSLDAIDFGLDCAGLVQPYLDPMVGGLSVICRFLDKRIQDGVKPRALCLGVGGGVLLEFLRSQLDFEVLGVEEDTMVLYVARKYFGLGHDQKFVVANAMSYIENENVSSFDVVMVDLDSNDVVSGICAPPLEFAKRSVFLSLRKLLSDGGAVVVNVIPSSEKFYENLKSEIHEVFEEVYEINAGNDDNFVVVAAKSKIENDASGMFLNKLRSVVSGSFIDSIRKIP